VAQRAPVEGSPIAAWFVPAVIGIAAAFFIWWFVA
jgi:hypothetical protein